MKKSLRKLFLPAKKYIRSCDKKRKPCFLSLRSVLLIFFAVVFLEFLFLANYTGKISFESFFAAIVPEELVVLTNIRREGERINTLTLNSSLERAAQMKANDMAEKGYFAHTSPEGLTPWHWFEQVNYNYRYAGENLAVNFSESYQVDEAWMNSPSHRENIVNERFEEIGIATARGEYKEREAVFVVQLFGTRFGQVATPSPEITTREEAVSAAIKEERSILGEKAIKEEEEEDVEKEESFAFMEKLEDERTLLAIGVPEKTLKPLGEEIKYTSFWAKVSSFPRRSLTYLFLGMGAVFLFTLILKLIFMRRVYLTFSLANEIVVLLVVASALLTNHYVLQIFV